MTSACILGCAGPVLSAEERAFFRKVQPWGFILFKRNIENREQVKALTAALRETVDRPDAPILIDQEGGRVQRMGPPEWPKYPAARTFSELAVNDPLVQRELVRLGARLMAHDLAEVGINVDCVPVLDVPAADGHEIIGDRAYALDVSGVAELGRAAAEGLIAGGVLPVIKHIPGHGRARADSHLELPTVSTPLADLEEIDFAPFRVLSDMPMAMTAHVVYNAIDPKNPATTSRKAIRLIRKDLGFGGLIMSDDLSMKALGGTFEERAKSALSAGCDVVLHCNGDMTEMKAVMRGTGALAGKSKARAKASLARLAKSTEPFDLEAGRARFAAAFS